LRVKRPILLSRDRFRPVPDAKSYFVRESDGLIIRLPRLQLRDLIPAMSTEGSLSLRAVSRKDPMMIYHIAVAARQGRMCVSIVDGGGAAKNHLAAEIIALALHGPKPSDGHRVGYRDLDQTNLDPGNLMWTTEAPPLRLTHRERASAKRHRQIVDLHMRGLSDAEIAAAMSVGLPGVHNFLAGRRVYDRRYRDRSTPNDPTRSVPTIGKGTP
jgi:hypothetical protein